MSRRAERLTVRARSERPCLRAVLRREDEADAAEVVFHVDGCFDVGELDLCVDLARDFKLGTDIEDSVMIKCNLVSVDASRGGKSIRERAHPGNERPGIPIWKSGMLPELTCPVTLATMLRFASTVPSNAIQIQSPIGVSIAIQIGLA
jgi:hypothetical protein